MDNGTFAKLKKEGSVYTVELYWDVSTKDLTQGCSETCSFDDIDRALAYIKRFIKGE